MELEDLLTEAARLLAQFSTEVKAASAASPVADTARDDSEPQVRATEQK
jgi:hypothetical protein